MTIKSTDLRRAQEFIEARKGLLELLNNLRGPNAGWETGCANVEVRSQGHRADLFERSTPAFFNALCDALKSEAARCEDMLASLGVVVVEKP